MKSALDVYEQVSDEESQELEGKKYPLIVLEGLDGCGMKITNLIMHIL